MGFPLLRFFFTVLIGTLYERVFYNSLCLTHLFQKDFLGEKNGEGIGENPEVTNSHTQENE